MDDDAKYLLMKKVSVIIPVHNHLRYTKSCLSALLSAFKNHDINYQDIPIVIVDDGSEDGTSKWVTDNYPFIHLLKGDGNLWWSGGINLGVKYSLNRLKMDYVLLWNNDLTPSPDYFKHVSLIINSDANLPIICSMQYYKQKPDTLISTGNFFNSKTGKFGSNNYGVKESEANLDKQQINWATGNGVLISKEVFETIGYFDANTFPQYHGDSDFGLRATIAGYRIHFDPHLKIWNDTSRTGSHAKKGSYKEFIDAFSSIRSNYNLSKDIKFYSKYATSKLAYKALLYKHLIYTLSFARRKFLGFFRLQRPQ